VTAEILLISAIYHFMPVGRVPAEHALIGGATAGLLWEFIRYQSVVLVVGMASLMRLPERATGRVIGQVLADSRGRRSLAAA
jgi:hypothetical protein